jgi:hypothetical protein
MSSFEMRPRKGETLQDYRSRHPKGGIKRKISSSGLSAKDQADLKAHIVSLQKGSKKVPGISAREAREHRIRMISRMLKGESVSKADEEVKKGKL